MTAPDVLAFSDRKVRGAFPVTEPSGAVVATIRVGFWSGTSFEAVGADGEPLCSGRRLGLLSNTWGVVDPRGSELASMRPSVWGTRKTVTLPAGRVLSVEGRVFSRDWALRDEQGDAVLTSTPTTAAWSFRPDAWVVRCHDASLDLAQVVAIVQLNRMVVKARRSASAAAS